VVRYNFPEYEIELEISKDIYFPAEDTFFLIESINLTDHHQSIIEIGGGSGIISIVLAQKNPKARFEKIMLLGGKKGYEETYSLIEYLRSSRIKTKLITVFSSLAWDVKKLKMFHKKGIKAEIINEKKLFFEKLYLVIFDFSDSNVDR